MLSDGRSESLEVRLADVDALSHFNPPGGARCPPQAKAGRRRVTGGPWIVTIGNRGWPATVRDPARIVLSFTRRLGRLASRRRGAISKEGRASGAHDRPGDAGREAKTQCQPGAVNEHDGADLTIGTQEGNVDRKLLDKVR